MSKEEGLGGGIMNLGQGRRLDFAAKEETP
jgi:hypothetical protein